MHSSSANQGSVAGEKAGAWGVGHIKKDELQLKGRRKPPKPFKQGSDAIRFVV